MILNDDEIKERIESPLNLLNRLKTSLSRTTSLIPVPSNTPSGPVTLPPKSEDIIDNLQDKLQNSTTRSKALNLLHTAMDELKTRIPEVQKPERLADIAEKMARVVSHHDNANQGSSSGSQIIVYAPQVQNIENFEVVEVVE